MLGNLVSMPEPTLCRNWLRNNAHAREYLRGLARGEIPLAHEALLDLPSWRTAVHLCDLLMAGGALPAVDRANMNTAVNPGCLWLFPGQRAGQ